MGQGTIDAADFCAVLESIGQGTLERRRVQLEAIAGLFDVGGQRVDYGAFVDFALEHGV
eukprot:CAMPEP_0118967340 /NCGR_PEP_ID=MMETSP1173-20130426/4744_1 /TAXON_ID=1034831 /ORGANISM="Rhizochromulina marina cf, Strain CCMP1243" /LENGTH=58 /DNA_ID=CAMNT_0006916291 /DNA_START=10 /DNA_END=183 /DNA_ORIENTATION=-